MGIKEINKFLIKNVKEGIKERHLSCYRNKIVAIDVSIFLYRILYQNKDRHIGGFVNLISKLGKYAIQPIFVFDGKPPKEKREVLNGRKKNLEKIKNKIVNFQVKLDILNNMENGDENVTENVVIINGNDNDSENKVDSEKRESSDLSDSIMSTSSDDSIENISNMSNMSNMSNDDKNKVKIDLEKKINKLNKKCIKIKNTHINDLKEFFDKLNIMYVHSNNMEADKVCANLVKTNYAYACISNDMDMLPFGCSRVLRDFNFYNHSIVEYNLSKIESSLGLSHEKFVDLCIMCGCDYNDKIIGLKPHTVYKYLKIYGNLENMVNNIEKINNFEEKRVRIPRRFDYESPRDIFISEVDKTAYEICNKNKNRCYSRRNLGSINYQWRSKHKRSWSESSINNTAKFTCNGFGYKSLDSMKNYLKNYLKVNLDKCNEFNNNISSNSSNRIIKISNSSNTSSRNNSNSSSRNSSNTSSRNSSSGDDWIIIENKNKTTDVFDKTEPKPKLSPTYKEIKTYLNNKCPYMKNHEIHHKLKWIFPRNEIFSSGR